MAEKRVSQEERLLSVLEDWDYKAWASGGWCPLTAILDIRPRIASHTKIISNLREHGHEIECEETWVKGELHTRYRLVRTTSVKQTELELTP